MKLTNVYSLRIYNDETGGYIEIRPDAGSLGLVEITSVASGDVEGRIVMTPEIAKALAAGIGEVMNLNAPKHHIEWVMPGASPFPTPAHQNK